MPRRPIRLLMLLHGYFPDEPRVAAQARAAASAGMEVDVLALRRPGDSAESVIDGVRCIRLPVEHVRGAGLAGTAVEYVRFTLHASVVAARLARRRRYDVVQVHNPPDFLVAAAFVPRLLGARIVFDVHDLASDMFVMRFAGRPGGRIAERILRVLERWAARVATTVLTVHEPYRRELIARGVDEGKVVVVMNSLDERLLPPDEANGRPLDGFTVFYHGTLTPHYGVGLVVEAAGMLRERIPDLRVHIFGEGDARPAIEERARALGVGDSLRIDDYVPQVDVLRVAKRASVGVVPNLPTRLNRFALSTKMLEYVALGVPVVAADLPTIREHFGSDEVRFFIAGDPSSLAEALADVAEDPAAAERRAAAARRRYEDYRWTPNAERYLDVIRGAAGRND